MVFLALPLAAVVASELVRRKEAAVMLGKRVGVSRFVVNDIALAFTVGSATYFFYKLFQVARHPQYRHLPMEKAGWNPFKRFILQNASDVYSPPKPGEDIFANFIWMSGTQERPTFLTIGGVGRLFCRNKEDIQYMLNTNVSNFEKGRGYEVFKRLLGDGLVTIFDDEVHKKNRRIVGPAFSPKALKLIAENSIPKHVSTFISDLKKEIAAGGDTSHRKGSSGGQDQGRKVTMQHKFIRLTLDIITDAAFKTRGDRSLNDAIQKNFDQGMKVMSMARIWKIVEMVQIFTNREVEQAKKRIHEAVDRIVARVKAEGNDGQDKVSKEEADTLIDYLIHSSLSSSEIADHSTTFLFAGSDTTSWGLTFLTYLLAKHPDKQKLLFEEIASCCSYGSTVPSAEDLAGCTYLAACCKEALRLYSPVYLVTRKARTDEVLPGTKTFVPKGMLCLMSFSGLHRDVDLWGQDADDFRPERWFETEGFDEKMSGTAFMPFSVGRRNCIGKDLAMNELQVIAATLVRNFEFSWPEGERDPVPTTAITIKTKQPFDVLVKDRQA